MAAPHARRTSRLTVILRAVAFACGGEQGARLAERLGIAASPDTLLREIRRSPNENCPPVRIVGVDDWALRRGKRYGTILVDLERHRPVDLLPDRSSEAFRGWLQGHPEIEIISRDRGDYYIKGADQGAPQAIQVADRWHLLHNLQEALVQLVDRHRKQLKEAARSLREATPVPVLVDVPISCVGTGLTKAAQARDQHRQRRLERYQQVVKLHAQGLAIREIARQLRMHRRTVRLWVARKTLPERAIPCSRRSVDVWIDYLHQRWQSGCHNASVLTAELRSKGYRGSYDMVRRCVAAWRQPGISKNALPPCLSARQPLHCDSPRSIAWALMKLSTKISSDWQNCFARLVRRWIRACSCRCSFED